MMPLFGPPIGARGWSVVSETFVSSGRQAINDGETYGRFYGGFRVFFGDLMVVPSDLMVVNGD